MTKIFKFRLESVLKLRKNKKRTERQALLEILSHRYRKEEEIEKTNIQYKKTLDLPQGKLKVEELQVSLSHRNFLKIKINKLENEKGQIIEIENIQREKFNQALSEEKALIKLKEKQKNEYVYEIEKEERNELDDIAQKHHNKSKELSIQIR